MATGSITDCCVALNPCDALCLLNNVMVDLATGKFVTSYTIGEERFTISRPTISDVRGLIDYYKTLCTDPEITAPLQRRRASVCFVPAPNHCARCRSSHCGCR